jgi:hypothetical protein
MSDREIMQMAFDAMINALAGNDFDNPYANMKQAAAALRDRLAQPEREWVWLTHEELAWLNEALNLGGRYAVIEAIEAKIREKNT